ncbi:hypothetical protein LMG19083_02849 [Ralstonia psammae]|uniref:Transmembrane protein n=1 Tax=Ralstonia psammae TaxID=3058598 RepID=A0ABM9JL53_9RALS|nr:hypothetical protein [Ralstonia sp. LMG 19083]CAJ0796318.1 hypothetical protein LMG19083_02849 [Ralstonia sp. LMG 19083]
MVSRSLGGFVVLVTALAIVAPGPLYVCALAVFGLPHVIWELGFLRSRYFARWPVGWWGVLMLVLLAHAALRALAWLGKVSMEAQQVLDLLALAALMLAVAAAPKGAGWPVRLVALLASGSVWAALEWGRIGDVLLVLALLHNFTPMAFAWDMARDDQHYRPQAQVAGLVFMLPLAVVALGAVGGWPASLTGLGLGWLDGQVPGLSGTAGGTLRAALLSAAVLAQCLHYYYVLKVLPRAEEQRTGRAPVPYWLRACTVLLTAGLAIYFVQRFGDARQLYGVAAGFHAWLEWPLLMFILCSRPSRAVTRSNFSTATG